jgi:hypothetical protein
MRSGTEEWEHQDIDGFTDADILKSNNSLSNVFQNTVEKIKQTSALKLPSTITMEHVASAMMTVN